MLLRLLVFRIKDSGDFVNSKHGYDMGGGAQINPFLK